MENPSQNSWTRAKEFQVQAKVAEKYLRLLLGFPQKHHSHNIYTEELLQTREGPVLVTLSL